MFSELQFSVTDKNFVERLYKDMMMSHSFLKQMVYSVHLKMMHYGNTRHNFEPSKINALNLLLFPFHNSSFLRLAIYLKASADTVLIFGNIGL